MQTVLALAVAEEAVEFEHRDLHWGNVLIKRVPVSQRSQCRLRCAMRGRHLSVACSDTARTVLPHSWNLEAPLAALPPSGLLTKLR